MFPVCPKHGHISGGRLLVFVVHNIIISVVRTVFLVLLAAVLRPGFSCSSIFPTGRRHGNISRDCLLVFVVHNILLMWLEESKVELRQSPPIWESVGKGEIMACPTVICHTSQRSGSREQGAGRREQGAGSRELGEGSTSRD